MGDVVPCRSRTPGSASPLGLGIRQVTFLPAVPLVGKLPFGILQLALRVLAGVFPRVRRLLRLHASRRLETRDLIQFRVTDWLASLKGAAKVLEAGREGLAEVDVDVPHSREGTTGGGGGHLGRESRCRLLGPRRARERRSGRAWRGLADLARSPFRRGHGYRRSPRRILLRPWRGVRCTSFVGPASAGSAESQSGRGNPLVTSRAGRQGATHHLGRRATATDSGESMGTREIKHRLLGAPQRRFLQKIDRHWRKKRVRYLRQRGTEGRIA
jgi:hypothetical protein